MGGGNYDRRRYASNSSASDVDRKIEEKSNDFPAIRKDHWWNREHATSESYSSFVREIQDIANKWINYIPSKRINEMRSRQESAGVFDFGKQISETGPGERKEILLQKFPYEKESARVCNFNPHTAVVGRE